ncbi:hypothetical protein DMA12_17165 [Amycolatopsis balhimycina DSM 5908]|uniref:Uncharacterized protein n=2 Tax=Amycolatopsis balhimycina TaxID=208443 RepID=A0A428WMN4_AMYBA|nr:hypothetical protein DMA12_17165 [Amycolatopsis balhimycina DSM 5908]
MGTPQLRGKLGPLLYGWCGIHRTADDREARREVRNAISAAIAKFPADERLAVTVALGIAPGTQHVLLNERIGVLADQLRISERTARRRIDRSFARLAAEIEAGTRRSGDAPDPGRGWSVQRLKVLVRLDVPQPELIEERQIVATRDGLRRISAMFTVPRAEDGRDVERQVVADALHGARITDIELEGNRHFRWLLDLPRPLACGESHTFSMAYRIRDDLPIRPTYTFVPLVPCESFSVRIRFDRRNPPSVVWRVDGVSPSVLSEPPQPGTPLAVDSAGEVAEDFSGLRLGNAYGLRWLL